MDYKASYDTLTKGLTAGVVLLFIVISLIQLWPVFTVQADQHSYVPGLLLVALFVAILGGTYLFSTERYTLTDTDLLIRRPIKDRVIKIAEISEIRLLERSELSGAIRTFGSGGLFGYFGKFYNGSLGHMTWYVTQRNKVILIRTAQGKIIIISPDDLHLVDEVKALQRKGH